MDKEHLKCMCDICGYIWYRRPIKIPVECPKCKRYDWNKGGEIIDEQSDSEEKGI